MESNVNYAAVGVFVIALGTALVIVILWLASGGDFRKQHDLYLALVNESVAGLNLNAPVKYRGVDVGKVQAIQLDPLNPETVRLIFAINRGTPIKQDTEAVLKTQGLTGIAYIELSGGSRDSPALEATAPDEYPTIRTTPSLSARLENVVTTVLTSVDRTSASINSILNDENRAALQSALSDMAAITHTVAARKATIDAGIASAARTFDDSSRLITSAARAVDEGSRLIASSGPAIDRIGRSAEALENMADEAGRLSAGAGKMIEGIAPDVKRFTAQTLPEVERLVGEMTVLSASLRRLSEQIERSPGGILFGRRPVPAGPGEQ